MNDREWIEATLAHREGKVPYNYMFSPRIEAALRQHYGTADLEGALRMPLRMGGPRSIKPLYAKPEQFGPTVRDEFGVVWTTNPIDRGAPIGPSLRTADLAAVQWPDPAASYRFEEIAAWSAAQVGHYRIVWVGDLWERATFMRGMEDLLLDLALNPAFVRRLLRRLADHILATARILLERFEFEGIALSDDYGAQHGMIISPRDWRALVKPLLAEIYGLAKGRGKTVFHHTCGHVTEIVPDLIEIGLDILHPIQPETMDIYGLKREFGAHLTFCGGLSTQQLLPNGTARQVRAEVRRLKEGLGAGGGYIFEPGITLQADVPLANILAMLDEAQA